MAFIVVYRLFTKCIFDFLCTVITLVNNETNLYMKKCHSHFAFFEKLFYFYVDLNIFVKTHVLFYFYNETRSSHQRCSMKAVLENFAIFTTKHL